jgi:superoxide dismutase, Fe-Mn family
VFDCKSTEADCKFHGEQNTVNDVYCKKQQIMERRTFLKSAGLLGAAVTFAPESFAGGKGSIATGAVLNALEFPSLPYAYDALEPHIDAQTMEIHYDKHHRAYYTNYLGAIKGTPLENQAPEQVFASISKHPDAVRNNGGGYYNHLVFWNNMSKQTGKPSKELDAAITKAFGSFDKFRETFSNAGKTRFGSGWAWLVMNRDKSLAVGSTANQDNPLMDAAPIKGVPLLALDVWEHAYYLKYQNRRPDYIEAWWKVVNWEEVNRRYSEAQKG